MTDILHFPADRTIRLKNIRCAYCGVDLLPHTATDEHVIGRKFVPKGKLNGQWNLIVQACRDCNGAKSDLEDDISAITMQPDAWGRYAIEDESLKQEAIRKARNSFSRRTRKPVGQSSEKLKLDMPFMGGTASFNLTTVPQVQSQRAFDLARMQVAGFFHFLTYDARTRLGGYMLGGYYPLMEALRSDWGNGVHRAFMDLVIDWDPRIATSTADGFFKIAVRKHLTLQCWSWAVEWNHKMRVVGFAGEESAVLECDKLIPHLTGRTVVSGKNSWLRTRKEVPLQEDLDRMFHDTLAVD